MHGGGGGGGGRLMRTAPLPESERRPVTTKTVRRILQFFRPYWLRVALTVVAIIAVAIIGLANPFLLKLIIDDAIPNRDLDRLYLYVGLMIALPIVTGLIGVGQTYLNTVIGQSVMQDLRNALYGHLQRMPLRFFTSTRTGEIQARLSSDVSGVQQVVTDTATSIVSNLATAISTVVAMWLISWQMTLISLGLLPIFLFVTYKVGEVRRDVKTETQETIADMTSQVEETLSVSGMLLTKAFGRQSRAVADFQGNQSAADAAANQAADDRSLVLHDHRDVFLHHPRVRLLVRRGADHRRQRVADDRGYRGVYHLAEPAVLSAGTDAQRPSRNPGGLRPV